MTSNDVLRSLRHALELTPAELCEYFARSGVAMPLEQMAAMLKQEDEPGYRALDDELFSAFLEGLIAFHRGAREPGPRPAQTVPITNNRVLRALRIAFELRDSDLQACMRAAGREVSKAELSALFRREDHRNYQPCGDQFLRTFLRGLGLVYRRVKRS